MDGLLRNLNRVNSHVRDWRAVSGGLNDDHSPTDDSRSVDRDRRRQLCSAAINLYVADCDIRVILTVAARSGRKQKLHCRSASEISAVESQSETGAALNACGSDRADVDAFDGADQGVDAPCRRAGWTDTCDAAT